MQGGLSSTFDTLYAKVICDTLCAGSAPSVCQKRIILYTFSVLRLILPGFTKALYYTLSVFAFACLFACCFHAISQKRIIYALLSGFRACPADLSRVFHVWACFPVRYSVGGLPVRCVASLVISGMGYPGLTSACRFGPPNPLNHSAENKSFLDLRCAFEFGPFPGFFLFARGKISEKFFYA